MGPFGRLWRRAPAWRLVLVTAVASTALAAMFPPSLPKGLVRLHRGPGNPAGGMPVPVTMQGSQAGARFTPQPAQTLAEYSTLDHPSLGMPRTGTIPFNGRQLPLPPGEWQVMEIGRSPAAMGALNVQVESFILLKSREVTGVLVALTPDPVIGGVPPPTFMQTCLAPDALTGQIAPPNPAKPLANECWVLTNTVLSATKDGAPGSIYLPELDRFRNAGLTVPEHMTALDYRQSDQNGWWVVTLFVPEAPEGSSVETRRLQLWAKTYAAALHRGFDMPSR